MCFTLEMLIEKIKIHDRKPPKHLKFSLPKWQPKLCDLIYLCLLKSSYHMINFKR